MYIEAMLKKELEVLERKIKAAERKVDLLYNDYNNALVEVMQSAYGYKWKYVQ